MKTILVIYNYLNNYYINCYKLNREELILDFINSIGNKEKKILIKIIKTTDSYYPDLIIEKLIKEEIENINNYSLEDLEFLIKTFFQEKEKEKQLNKIYKLFNKKIENKKSKIMIDKI